MTLSNAAAVVELAAQATHTGTHVSGNVTVGQRNLRIPLTGATAAFSVRAIFMSQGADMSVDPTDGGTSTTSAFSAGTSQVETATASGTASSNGIVNVIVTSAGMEGSPLTIPVSVSASDTASAWAAKVRAALLANPTISDRFNIGGSGTSIQLTRAPQVLPIATSPITVASYANDSTLNIEIENGSPAPGVSNAETSTNSTAGVAASGTIILNGDGRDFEGATIRTFTPRAVLIQTVGDIGVTDSRTDGLKGETMADCTLLEVHPNGMTTSGYTFEAKGSTFPQEVTLTSIG